jgi:phospholipase/carboxylesterase
MQTSVSRRDVLLTALASGSLACGRRVPRQAAAAADTTAPWGGLEVALPGPTRDGARGGNAVVLLHGWGAQGDDLVPLAAELEQPGVRFVVPAGLLPEVGGGRAWWHLHDADRPAQASNDEPPLQSPNARLQAARDAVRGVLRTVAERWAPERLFLVGFSQGAMLSLDLALAGAPRIDRVAVLSGVMLADSVPGLLAPPTPRPPIFVSHGRQDPILPFGAGERMRTLLQKHGFAVDWHPFDGGHTIPASIVAALRAFLFGV